MAGEVGAVQAGPQGGGARAGAGGQQGQGLALAAGGQGAGAGGVAAQRARAGVVELLQELVFPAVPHARAGGADVGHGEQIQAVELALAAHALGKAGDDGRIAKVLFLRGLAHEQVLAHEKFDQAGVVCADGALAAKAAHFARAQFAVIAPPAFGDVVKQRGHQQQPGLAPAPRHLRAQGVFVGEFGDEKAPHVAQRDEAVLIDGVGVKQVVLHLPDDAAKHPQVAPQHAGVVHQPQGVGLPGRGLEDAQKQGVIGRVGAKAPVHHAAGVVERAQGAHAQLAHFGAALIQPEGLQDGARVALIQVVAANFQRAIDFAEPGVDAARRRGRFARGAQALLHDLQQDFAQLRHGLGAPVIAAHELLAGAQGQAAIGAVARAVAKGLRQRRLAVEHQAVFAAPGQQVQPGANQAQKLLVARQLAHLARRGHARVRQRRPACAQAGGARRPAQHVQIAQPAGRLLAIGLQRVGRVLLARVALALLQALGLHESQRIQLRGKSLLKAGAKRRIARHKSRLQQRRAQAQIFPRRRQRLIRRAHAGADGQAHIPARRHKSAHGLRRIARRGFRRDFR